MFVSAFYIQTNATQSSKSVDSQLSSASHSQYHEKFGNGHALEFMLYINHYKRYRLSSLNESDNDEIKANPHFFWRYIQATHSTVDRSFREIS